MTRLQNLGIRIVSVLLCLACLLVLAQPTAVCAQESEVQQTMTTVVRYSAYYSASVIGQFEDGTKVTVLGEKKDFYKVDCYDMTGYIARSQIVHTENDEYYVNCVEGSSETRALTYTGYADALEMQHSLLALAKKQLGSRYVYGASRPGAFDCSGLTYYLYGKHETSIHRTASTQLQDGIIVPKEALQVGDLVFFKERGYSTIATHVGIYVGGNQIIHSGSKGVEYADLDFDYFDKYYLCARRIVNTGAVQLESSADSALTATSVTGRTAG